jgi:hypothetical protein
MGWVAKCQEFSAHYAQNSEQFRRKAGMSVTIVLKSCNSCKRLRAWRSPFPPRYLLLRHRVILPASFPPSIPSRCDHTCARDAGSPSSQASLSCRSAQRAGTPRRCGSRRLVSAVASEADLHQHPRGPDLADRRTTASDEAWSGAVSALQNFRREFVSSGMEPGAAVVSQPAANGRGAAWLSRGAVTAGNGAAARVGSNCRCRLLRPADHQRHRRFAPGEGKRRPRGSGRLWLCGSARGTAGLHRVLSSLSEQRGDGSGYPRPERDLPGRGSPSDFFQRNGRSPVRDQGFSVTIQPASSSGAGF